MQRVLEPEVMDTWEEAVEYDAMDFTEVNTAFALRAIALGPTSGLVLDAGTGTARIPIIICQQRPLWQVTGIDLSQNMLLLGTQNVKQAGLQQQIVLEWVDAKQLTYPDSQFDMLISNSLVHHLPDPLPFFVELQRVLKPNGGILIRDLIRPPDAAAIKALVARVGPEYSQHQQQLFHDSLQAALTLDEVQTLLLRAGLAGVKVYQSSDLHWTAERIWAEPE